MRTFRFLLVAISAWLGFASPSTAQPAQGSFTVGLLLPLGLGDGLPPPLVKALGDLGYVQGRNLTFVVKATKANNGELPALAAELVALKPDLIISPSTPPSLALKNATTTIPIVMVNIGDPIKSRLVASFARPGGNVTGTANGSEVWFTKRMQAIVETLPGTHCLINLRNPSNVSIMQVGNQLDALAAKLGLVFHPIDAATGEELDRALAAPLDPNCASAMMLPLDGLFIARRAQLVEFALSHKIALFAPFREDAEAGALMAFGVNFDDQWRLAAGYVDEILKGAKPADLPVQLPTRYDIVVNLKTAKSIGVAVPQSILAAASDVIE